MMKKIFVIGLIVCSFFIVSISPVIAITDTHVITDIEGDVADEYGTNASSSPTINIKNIDIREMTYSRQDKRITLTLTVYGNIQDTGNIDEVESFTGTNYVVYILLLYTSNESYTIYYVNKECRIAYQDIIDNISDFSVAGSTLTVPFDLLSNNEIYDEIGATTEYYKESGDNYEDLSDTAPDLITLEVTADGPSEGKIGESIAFYGEAPGGTPEPEYAWLWDFDDGNTSTDQNPIHSYEETGTYEVTLSVTDANYNEGSSSLTITISDAEPSNGGNNGGTEEGESSNSGLILFIVVIAVIFIAGIAVIVYIIRR
jgi:hypothetical protein